MRISDWSSDVCSSDLSSGEDREARRQPKLQRRASFALEAEAILRILDLVHEIAVRHRAEIAHVPLDRFKVAVAVVAACQGIEMTDPRSEEHTSELQSLMRISYAVFCLKKKKKD